MYLCMWVHNETRSPETIDMFSICGVPGFKTSYYTHELVSGKLTCTFRTYSSDTELQDFVTTYVQLQASVSSFLIVTVVLYGLLTSLTID
jgi:hypothetical protein